MLESIPITTTQALFSGAKVDETTKVVSGKEATSKVNFSIGDTYKPKFYDETSAKAAFEVPAQAPRANFDAQAIRQANFQVGNEKLEYITTTQAVQNSFKS
jgi:hypothetical protein